jgi:hypothetical protein
VRVHGAGDEDQWQRDDKDRPDHQHATQPTPHRRSTGRATQGVRHTSTAPDWSEPGRIQRDDRSEVAPRG